MSTAVNYAEELNALSEASVRKHFQAFVDIPWDDPAYEIVPNDPRWKLPAVDPLGSHSWYLSQTEERQIEIGLMRQADIAKVGVHFENLLMRGLLTYVVSVPNGSPEFRYSMHEVTEETHHTQMFQEFVNRTGLDVPGSPRYFQLLGHTAPLIAVMLPEIFFAAVLLGEEPLDHVQKTILRATGELHPLIQRIMQIHVAEEARHISFANEFLAKNVPDLNFARRALLAVLFPLTARMIADVLSPSYKWADMAGVPRSVIKELYYNSDDGRDLLAEMFGDVRRLVDRIGLLNSVTRPIWNSLGVGGRPSRFRGETAEFTAVAE
ncbi:diiron oxygenase [Hoyosella sp. YIM 151337]|uniref:AurF N-oxygenase family protein n=1 Tax=Hoyosella sp. YIM 151337 TaxID=2992742 RepID=UPI002235D5C6|nr:diiron oxygenase [Hoyosella sp. YIM 151337]MCW4355193.1 diiron oxygenase [Hoyosella sp. YIM 151337]